MMGPDMALANGEYEFEIEVAWDECDDPSTTIARLDIVAWPDVLAEVDLVPDSISGHHGRRLSRRPARAMLRRSCPFVWHGRGSNCGAVIAKGVS